MADVSGQRADAADNRRTRVQTQARGSRERYRSADHEEEDEQRHPELDQQLDSDRYRALHNRPQFDGEFGGGYVRLRTRHLSRQFLGCSCRGIGQVGRQLDGQLGHCEEDGRDDQRQCQHHHQDSQHQRQPTWQPAVRQTARDRQHRDGDHHRQQNRVEDRRGCPDSEQNDENGCQAYEVDRQAIREIIHAVAASG